MEMYTGKSASIFCTNRYIEYIPGDLNVIICIPHDGHLKPDSMPSRAPKDGSKARDIVTTRDTSTKALGLKLASELHLLTNKCPHVIICHLKRNVLDANRDIENGTLGFKGAIDAWTAYHAFVEQARSSIEGNGLLLDIHGHSHSEGWIELGYTLSRKQLNQELQDCDECSISALTFRTGSYLQDTICGQNSFGSLLAQYGYKVVPSEAIPSPNTGNYFPGGYTSRTYGSRKGGNIDAIQIESPKHLRNPKSIPAYGKHIALTVLQYLQLFYDFPKAS